MSYEGPQFYDNPQVFEIYQQHRQRSDNPNDTLEKPMMVELLGNVEAPASSILVVEMQQWGRNCSRTVRLPIWD